MTARMRSGRQEEDGRWSHPHRRQKRPASRFVKNGRNPSTKAALTNPTIITTVNHTWTLGRYRSAPTARTSGAAQIDWHRRDPIAAQTVALQAKEEAQSKNDGIAGNERECHPRLEPAARN